MTKYSLKQIKENPNLLTYEIAWNNEILILRPLEETDAESLATFFEGLSEDTRDKYYLDDFTIKKAKEFCESIAVYDKLRFILVRSNRVIGIFEYSQDIPQSDNDRLNAYNLNYNEDLMCRFGPCLADEYQGKGIASIIFPYIKDIASKTGHTSILLWGGVLKRNDKAINYYKAKGFKLLGEFTAPDNEQCLDMVLEL